MTQKTKPKTDANERIIRNRLAEASADIKDAKTLEGEERLDLIGRAREALMSAETAAAAIVASSSKPPA